MKILLLAGEESGELYARQIRERFAHDEVRGYGDYGFRTEDLAVMGIEEVLKNIFFLLRVKRTMERAIDAWRPDVVCTIDYPGMNMKLAAYARARGIRTVHVVCPQVWAWKAGRIPKIERTFDRLCCFLPFEPGIFRPGFAEFVGHPLAEQFKREEGSGKRDEGSGMREEGLTLALLPGSRLGEIEKHLPVMLETLRSMALPAGLRVEIPAANDRAYAAISRVVDAVVRQRPVADCQLSVSHGGARELLLRADCAVVASGTATLEAALAGCPTVLVYKASPIFAFIARRVIKGIRFVGLANIIWDKTLSQRGIPPPVSEAPMPELLQENLTVENLRRELQPLLSDAAARQRAKARLSAATDLLKSDGDAIGRIAAAVRMSCWTSFSPGVSPLSGAT